MFNWAKKKKQRTPSPSPAPDVGVAAAAHMPPAPVAAAPMPEGIPPARAGTLAPEHMRIGRAPTSGLGQHRLDTRRDHSSPPLRGGPKSAVRVNKDELNFQNPDGSYFNYKQGDLNLVNKDGSRVTMDDSGAGFTSSAGEGVRMTGGDNIRLETNYMTIERGAGGGAGPGGGGGGGGGGEGWDAGGGHRRGGSRHQRSRYDYDDEYDYDDYDDRRFGRPRSFHRSAPPGRRFSGRYCCESSGCCCGGGGGSCNYSQCGGGTCNYSQCGGAPPSGQYQATYCMNNQPQQVSRTHTHTHTYQPVPYTPPQHVSYTVPGYFHGPVPGQYQQGEAQYGGMGYGTAPVTSIGGVPVILPLDK
eukprot:GHVU01178456.1.p1 GENE.GHVU01178456.1~~GHVU01178456.1.p1  ORF type:complete len:357 (-),score=32.59 GHVU01178456.1:870-1940(-)